MRKILILFFLIISLFVVFVIPASAAVIDPSSYGDYRVDGDKIIYYLNNQFDLFTWRRLHDGSLGSIGSGQFFSYNTQMRYVDNDEIYLFPFGYSGGKSAVIDLGAYPLCSEITFSAQFELSVLNSTQDFSTQLFYYWNWYDVNGNPLGGYNSVIAPIERGQGLRQYNLTNTFSCDDPNVRYFDLYFRWDFSGVANESDTVSVTVDADTYGLSFGFPVDRLGQLIDQGKLTNQQLDKIDQALQDNGQKLDDVVAGNQQIHDDINNAVNGTLPPADVPAGNDKIDDLDNHEGQLRDDAAAGLQQGLDMMDDTLDALFTYSFGFFALGLVFELFFHLPFFNVLVSLSLVLGILASFLGIIVSISSAGGGRYSKHKSSQHRSMNSKQGGKS